MGYSIAAESFASLEKSWPDLLGASATNHIFLTPQWQQAWWRTIGNGSELLLLSAQQDSQPIGIMPLRRQGEVIFFIGSGDVCDYMDFIARRGQEAAVFAQLMDYLEHTDWSSIDLHALRPDSLALSYFAPLARERGYLVEIVQEDVSPEVALPSSWDEYLLLLKKKDRHELRRKLRRLEEVPSTRFYTITEKGQLIQELETFFQLFQLSTGEKAEFMTEQRRGFFEAIVNSLAEEGYVRLSFLEINGFRVASTLGFDYKNELYLYNSAYDPAYPSLSVGLLVKVYCLRDGILQGKSRFDFLRGSEPYKYDLGGRDVPVYRCVISRV